MDLNIQLNLWWLIIGVLLLALVLLAVSVKPTARWWKYRQLKQASWNPHEREIEGFGLVHVHPMPVPMRLALAGLQASDPDPMAIYLTLIGWCIDEFRGRPPEQIGMDFSPEVIRLLAEAVLDVAGLTPKSQGENVKKLEAVQS